MFTPPVRMGNSVLSNAAGAIGAWASTSSSSRITTSGTTNPHLSDTGFKVFSALELSCRGGREHVVALGIHEWYGRKDTQEAINWVNGLGGAPILCHPFWSRISLRRALEIKDYPLLEVWNTHGGLKYARESSHFWDLLLEEGRRVLRSHGDHTRTETRWRRI